MLENDQTLGETESYPLSSIEMLIDICVLKTKLTVGSARVTMYERKADVGSE